MRRTYLHLVAIGLVILWLVAIFVALSADYSHGSEPPIGTVYVTRNLDESLNTSPGYWNHLAIYVGGGQVVEAQSEHGVIETPLCDFLARPYEVKRYLPRAEAIGIRAAESAKSFVGKPYGPIASIGPLWRFGRHNCVSVIELAYDDATNHRWWWIRRPDHVTRLVAK